MRTDHAGRKNNDHNNYRGIILLKSGVCFTRENNGTWR